MTNAPVAKNNPEKTSKIWALIPCGGNGSRAKRDDSDLNDVPKQYRVIAGKAMVLHTLAAFEGVERLAGMLVVAAQTDDYLTEILKNTTISIANNAGNTRASTVFNGLKALLEQEGANSHDWVLVHDAARCLITTTQINGLIDACKDDAVGGLLALPLPDTLKSEQSGRVSVTLARSDKWLAQTPQMFRIGELITALQTAAAQQAEVTDESSAMERMGLQPQLVRGSTHNFKVTYPEDFALAEAMLASR
jgi:2-C-methyl-D-erythritol 4-phosphate cytidylyltransferase